MILRFSTVLLLPILSSASSNTVSITHRSIGTRDYTQGLNVVKTELSDDTEYVTSFYKRVQHKVKDRDGLFSKEYDEHELTSLPPKEEPKPKRKPFSFLQKTHSQDAAVVRGGAASSLKMQSPPHLNKYSSGDRNGHKSKKTGSFGTPSFKKQPRRESVEYSNEVKADSDDLFFREYDDYEQSNDYYTETNEDQDDYPPGEHHLGLLRVPCSIAINSGEDGRFDHYSGSRGGAFDDHYVKKTPIAAYVDTGAQVTVISASAARRAGILHLMDRRYAGRATGVGHCRVLGRIPARHVYFFLGDDNEVHCSRGEVDQESTVQMDGPALTVLEGTVTKGVDMLLGLDVLQDWDAEIRMGSSKSITVRKKEGRNSRLKDGNSVVIPFVTSQGEKKRHAQHDAERHHRSESAQNKIMSHHSKARQHSHHGLSAKSSKHNSHHDSASTHRRHELTASYEDDDEYFSPTASDIESDLDLLEQTNHHQDELEEDMDTEILPRDFDDELANSRDNGNEEEEDYLQDVEEEDANEEHFDMSGL